MRNKEGRNEKMKLTLLNTLLVGILFSSKLSIAIGGPTSDPCSATTCGKGAECRVRSNLVVCICPENAPEGDPFIECTPVSSTSEKESTTSATTVVSMQTFDSSPVTQSSQKIHNTIVEFNNTKEENNPKTDPISFPSAPPTLSHFAHTPPFYQPMNPSHHQQMTNTPFAVDAPPPTSYQPNPVTRIRNRPSYQGTINHDEASSHYPQESPPQPPSTAINRDSNGNPSINRIQLEKNSEDSSQFSPQRHTPLTNNNQQPHHEFHSPMGNRVVPSNHHNFPQAQNPPQNFKQEAQDPARQGIHSKDPLGIYGDCITVNNRIVCADTSAAATQDSTDVHRNRQPQVNPGSGFEHRHIAVAGNDNFFNPPSRGESTKLGEDHHLRPHFHHPTHHHSGPSGTVNFFPPSSTEVQPDSITKGSSKPEILHHFPETKPYDPQAGTHEAIMCKQMCGEGSVCRVFHNRPICGCPEGFTGDPSRRCFPVESGTKDPNFCLRHTDCPSSMVCHNSACTDPCQLKNTFDKSNISSFHYSLDSTPNKNENMCGLNAKCSVIEHTPVCSCEKNTYGNPYVGCVP